MGAHITDPVKASNKEHKLNSNCDSWGHDEASAATGHQCESFVQIGTTHLVGGVDE